MKNQIQLSATVDAVFALSSLKAAGGGDGALPGPYGRDDEEALTALARRNFMELCGELGMTPASDGSVAVELDGDHHELLQAVVTDRTVAALCGREPCGELLRRLRCRVRRRPSPSRPRY